MSESKKYFTIGQLSRNTDVPGYTLRYWENEKLLFPVRKSSGQRIYDEKDEELVFKIKDLLYSKKIRIEGVKKYLKAGKNKKNNDYPLSPEVFIETNLLKVIKREISGILELLEKL
ncbi:MAG: MerR family transcriptional regulator [Elusimicrobiota bacterium]|jgi:DNA-binding transcriptional MerR regulator|nr:MerR family transcriptional regulator [Elusimicrobiota bacterium]